MKSILEILERCLLLDLKGRKTSVSRQSRLDRKKVTG